MARKNPKPKDPPKVKKYSRRARSVVHNAGSVYDIGIARGLLLSLKTDGIIDKSRLDQLFKEVLRKVKKEQPRLLRRLPTELLANLGKGVRAPASPRTRRGRR
jgi:hypothetical protein